MSFTGQNPRFRSTILTDIGVASIANPASGSHRLINRAGALFVQDPAGLETGIGAGGTVDKVTQTAHGFTEGEILYYTGSAYARALANAANTSEIVGMVSRVIDVDTFEVTLEGKVTGLSGLTAGEAYFLSPTVSGAITATEPTVLGHVSLPIGVAISTTVIYVRSSRGAVVGSSNARTEIALGNNTVTNVQSVAAYQAGELTGWVEIDGTTDLKFYVAAPFAKNGAATDYNISPQYVGDTPPVGFSLSVTSGGIIQATLPSIAGYVSAKINFALNAPAVGATFPLSIDSTLVQFSTLKAKDSGGFIFQENGGTQIGSISDSGAWTLGASSGVTGTHSIQSDGGASWTAAIQATNASAASGSSNGLRISAGITAADTPFYLTNRAQSSVLSICTGVGAWTFGASGGVEVHQFHGALQFSTGSSTPTPTYGLRRNGSNALEFFTNSGSAGTIGSSQEWTFGNSTTASTTHSFYGIQANVNYTALTNGQTSGYRVSAQSGSDTRTSYIGVYKHGGITKPTGFFWLAYSEDAADTPAYFWVPTSDGKFRISGSASNVGTTGGTVVGDQTSDERLKVGIYDTTYGLETVLNLRPINFSMHGKNQVGFSAQHTRNVVPEAVYDTGEVIVEGEETKLAMEYVQIIPVLTKAIQELSAKVTALESLLN